MDVNSNEVMAYVNLAEGMGRVRNNAKLFKRMLGMYLAGKEFAQMDDALAGGQLVEAADAAHAIKGMSGNLGLTAVFETSTKMMNELRGGNFDQASYASYKDACVKTREIVEYLVNVHFAE